MLFDTHVHSKYSFDSETSPEEAIKSAQIQGFGIIFTEHVDLEMPGVAPEKLVWDTRSYLREYEPFKTERVLTGLEIGLTPATAEQNAKIASVMRLDFVIGSVHAAYGYDIAMPDYWRSPDFADPKAAYLESVAEMIEACDFFDSLGHIDYPGRYCPFDDKEIRYRDYINLYNRIFDALCKNGKVMEINTKSLGHAAGADRVLGEILSGYAGRGGRYVTLGSDAHSAAEVGHCFGLARKIAKAAGLEPVYFRGRVMEK